MNLFKKKTLFSIENENTCIYMRHIVTYLKNVKIFFDFSGIFPLDVEIVALSKVNSFKVKTNK